MRNLDFENSPSGKLVPTVFDAMAFVPNPLPPQYDLAKFAHQFGDAMNAVGELRGACRLLSNPYILIRPLQRLEAQTSSAMEGTFTTADELVMAEAGVAKSPRADAIEVRNYISALSWAERELNNIPISVRLIKGAHKILLSDVERGRGQDKQPGEFARNQNMIGGTNIKNARFIPPPPNETKAAMADLEKFVNRDDKVNALSIIDLALVHYQFETIHPFADGNGRVGRMLISLMAKSEGLLDMPALYMSPELEERKDEYIDLMYQVSSEGDWNEYLKFFLIVLAESCRRATKTIDRILTLQKNYQDLARSVSRSSNMSALVDMLFDSPVIFPSLIVEKIGITDAAARNLLKQLTEINILTEWRETYPTLWFADEIIDVSRPSTQME